MRLRRVRFFRFLMASALICPTFSEFALSVKAMGEVDINSSISDSIISELEDMNNILQNTVGDETNSSVINEVVSEDVVEEKLEELVEDSLSENMVEENKEIVETDESEITIVTDEVQSRNSKSGLVQLYQVVPDGQQSKEGKTTREIMSALQCRPNHDLYPLNNTSQHTTYVNSCYVDDAMYLGEDSNYFYIYLSGYEGKVAKSKSHYYDLDLNNDGVKVTYEIQTVAYFIPEAATTYSLETKEKSSAIEAPELLFNDDYLDKEGNDGDIALARTSKVVLGPSYYANESGNLVHYITNNVTASNNYSKTIIGKAPSWMNSNVKYYSYDGVYFYNHWNQIKVNGSGAVNQNNPFYNYYQYLPYRSKSVYTASAFDNFTNSYGYSKLPTGSTASSNESQLVNAGSIFYSVQDKFGVNGALEYAMAIHESGWGRSTISVQKNNLFGMNATDNNPYGNATSFPYVENGIFYHSDYYISRGYTNPNDWRYFGSHVGNKGSGMNVKYASDPFWGEKIAAWYYKLDTANGLKDYNQYTIGINNKGSVYNIRQQANTSSSILYKTKNSSSNIYNYPFLIVGQSGDFYKIKTDTPIVNGVAQYSAVYDWDSTYAYVSKDAINSINHTNYVDPHLKMEIVNRLSTFKMNGTQIIYDGYAYIRGVDIPNQSNIQQKIVVKDSNAKSVASIMLDNYYSTSVSKAAAHGNNKYNYDWAKVKGSFTLPALSDGEYMLMMRINAKGITDEVPLILHSSIGYFNYKNNNKLYEFYPTEDKVTLKVSTLTPKDNPHINRLSYIRNENGKLYLDGYSYIQQVNIPSQTDIIQKIKFVNTSTLQQVLTFDLPTFYSTAATKDPNHGNNVYNYDWAKYRGSVDISSLPVGEYYLKIYTNSKGYQFDTIATIHSGVQNFNIKTNGKTISFNRVTYEGISTFKVIVTNN